MHTITISDPEAYISVFIRGDFLDATVDWLWESFQAIPESGALARQENGVGCYFNGNVDVDILNARLYDLLQQAGLMDAVGLSVTPFWLVRIRFDPALTEEQMHERRDQLQQLPNVWHALSYEKGNGLLFELFIPPTAEFYGKVVSVIMA